MADSEQGRLRFPVAHDFLTGRLYYYLHRFHFFPALNFAHRARCAAAILFLPAAEIVRFGLGARPFAFAQRAFCARLIRLRPAADMVWLLPPPNLPRTERAEST
jgi:hypothetical protein